MLGVDALGQLDQQRRITRRQNPNAQAGHRDARASSAVEQLLVNVVEAAVRHDDHEVAVSRSLARRSRRCRRPAGCSGRRLPAACRSVDQLLGRQPLSSGSVERNTAGRITRSALRQRAARNPSWNMRRHDVAERGSKIAQIRRSGIRRADAGERFGNRGRMMREVVVDRDAARRAAQLHPAADALEPARARPPSCRCSARRPRRRRSPRARCARCRRRAAAARTCRPASPLRRTLNVVDRAASTLQIVRLPVGAVATARTSRRGSARASRSAQRLGVVGAEQQQAAARHRLTKRRNASRIGVQIGIDVGVVVLDVVDDGDVRQVLEELRGLVEERAVVLVPLDDELAAAADAVAARRSSRRCRR